MYKYTLVSDRYSGQPETYTRAEFDAMCIHAFGEAAVLHEDADGNLCDDQGVVLETLPDYGSLNDYRTGEALRPATEEERDESVEAAKTDGGRGVISVDGRSCYVEDWA